MHRRTAVTTIINQKRSDGRGKLPYSTDSLLKLCVVDENRAEDNSRIALLLAPVQGQLQMWATPIQVPYPTHWAPFILTPPGM
jgi:hypothetical protein